MKKQFIILIGSILTASMLTACGSDDSNEESKLIGSWYKKSGDTNVQRLVIYENGNCDINNDVGTWSISETKISIINPDDYSWSSDSLIGTFSVKDDTLTLTNVSVGGDSIEPEIIYEKQEE